MGDWEERGKYGAREFMGTAFFRWGVGVVVAWCCAGAAGMAAAWQGRKSATATRSREKETVWVWALLDWAEDLPFVDGVLSVIFFGKKIVDGFRALVELNSRCAISLFWSSSQDFVLEKNVKNRIKIAF